MKNTILIIIALYLLLLETGHSQSPITFYAHLSVDNYLEDRQINRIDRDQAGLFWFLENSVIQRYDGRFVSEKIPHNVLNPKYFKCLSDNTILLISQESQIYSIDKEEKSVTPLRFAPKDCNNCELIDVNLISESIILYYKTDSTIKVYASLDRKNLNEIRELTFTNLKDISNIFKVGDDYLLLTNNDKVYVDKNNVKTELALSPLFRELNASVISNYTDDNELFFSLRRRNGTYQYAEGKFETLSKNEKLVFAKKDRKGRLLLALSRSYLHSEEIRIVDGENSYPWPELSAINETFIDAYVEDLESKLLLGSHTGVFFVDLQKPGIIPYHQSEQLRSNFGNVIMNFTQLPNGDVYYVKENKGLFIYDQDKEPNSLPISDQLLNNLNCNYDPIDDQIWISGYTNERRGVLYSYNYQHEKVIQHDFDRPVMYFKRINENELIISTSVTSKSLIIKYNIEEKRATDTLAVLDDERSRKFEFHGEDQLIVATSKRLLALNLSDKSIRTIVPQTAIQSVVKIRNGYGACTLGKGIIIIDNNLNIVNSVDESDGLTSNQVYSLTEDQQGKYWIGTGNGLNVIDSDYRFIRSFRQQDGMSSYELNTNSSVILQNGDLLFGTINGVTQVKPDLALSISESAVLNVPSISYLKDGDRVIQKVQGEEFNIPADARDLSISLQQNDFYKYINIDNAIVPRIMTYPEDLHYEMKENEIIIPTLTSSSTKFNILPANPLKASEKVSLVLTKKNNYQNLITILLVVGMVGLISYFITNRIIKFNKNREKERRENEVRMAELELQALRSQMNPHFIFNSLGAILLYLQTHENKKAEKYLTKFAKLMRMYLESSKSKFISFADERILLELYLELEKLRFEDKFDYQFIIDPRLDVNSITLPSMLLQPFVENAINHGLYHKKSNDGLLVIKAIPDGQNVKVIIRDNGVGRARTKEIRDDSLKKHKSRATQIIQERIQVLKKEKNIDIDIIYNDLVGPDGSGMGTEVIITSPKMFRE